MPLPRTTPATPRYPTSVVIELYAADAVANILLTSHLGVPDMGFRCHDGRYHMKWEIDTECLGLFNANLRKACDELSGVIQACGATGESPYAVLKVGRP